MLVAALFNPRTAFASKMCFLFGLALAYPYGPIDLIPNSTPVIGYLDQVCFFIAGVVLAYWLAPPELRGRTPAAPAAACVKTLAAARATRLPLKVRIVQRGRALVLDGFAWAGARPILRLSTGAWPSAADIALFRQSLRRFTPLPPLMRAISAVPAGRNQLTRAMLASWLQADEAYRGVLREELAPNAPGAAGGGNCLRIWTGPRVTFLHLEKTAGMAVTEVLGAQFHPLQIDADARRAFPPHVLSPLPPFLLDRVRRTSLVWGHYDLPSVRRLGPDRFVFTFLREPGARILSLYYYWRGQAALDLGWNGMNQPVVAAQQLPLAEFLASENPMIRNYLDNFYVRRLTGIYRDCPHGDRLAAEPQACLTEALAALDTLDFVGITEQTDASMAHLGSLLGFTPPARTPRVNVTRQEDTARVGADPEIAAALDRLTVLDRVVYQEALLRFRN